jgi:hypothetical protein
LLKEGKYRQLHYLKKPFENITETIAGLDYLHSEEFLKQDHYEKEY